MFSPSMKLDVGFAISESVVTRRGFVADRHALDKRNARRARLEHEFQAALATLTAHGANLCKFVSFATIVREMTLRTLMRRVCRSSFRRRHTACFGRHTITKSRAW